MKQSKIFEVYEKGRNIYTKSLAPGKKVYGERIFREGNVEYREWDPKRSKLGALIMKKCTNIFIRKGAVVLYLGAASGTTVSHVSDIVGEKGMVYAIEFSPTVLRDLIYVAEDRPNIAPVMGDASKPGSYSDRISQVDVVFQDIAQRDQAGILIANCKKFLKKGGYALVAIKARSIDR